MSTPPVSGAGRGGDLLLWARIVRAADSGEDWRETARALLDIDPAADPQRAREAYDATLAKARWYWGGDKPGGKADTNRSP